MNALIRTQNNNFYCSTVFAYFDKGWKSSVIVLDENNSQLLIVNNHFLRFGTARRDVLFVDERQDNWVKNGKWSGLDFIINDKNLLRSIKKGIDIPFDILEKCRSLQTTETFNGWNMIDTEDDIMKLMNISLGFHDGNIDNIEHDGNDVYVKFDCWSCSITIKFVDLIKFNEAKEISWENNYIFEAKMCFDSGNIRWYVDNLGITEYDDQECYFVSKSAQYKIELRNSF